MELVSVFCSSLYSRLNLTVPGRYEAVEQEQCQPSEVSPWSSKHSQESIFLWISQWPLKCCEWRVKLISSISHCQLLFQYHVPTKLIVCLSSRAAMSSHGSHSNNLCWTFPCWVAHAIKTHRDRYRYPGRYPDGFWQSPTRELYNLSGNLCKSCITHTVNICFLIFRWNFLCYSLCHLVIVLAPDTTEKSLSLSSLYPPFRRSISSLDLLAIICLM